MTRTYSMFIATTNNIETVRGTYATLVATLTGLLLRGEKFNIQSLSVSGHKLDAECVAMLRKSAEQWLETHDRKVVADHIDRAFWDSSDRREAKTAKTWA